MAIGSIPSIIMLGLVSVVGVVFAFDGYNLTDKLLAWTGWIVGAGAGGAMGWLAATNASGSPDRLLAAGVALVIGALLGRLFIPLVSWLAVVLLGFVSTSLAAAFVLAGQQLATTVSQLDLDISSPQNLEFLLEQLSATPVFRDQQVILLTLFAGLVGALLASQYYDFIITTAVTTIGAALLSVALPLWEQAASGGVALSESALGDLSTGLFVFLLAAGLLVQGYRYRDELGLPFLESDDDPFSIE